jgi:hypothetical protein
MSGKQTGSALPTGYMLGEYKIESVLGIGGFGVTYKAEDTALNATVAIKEYFPQAFASRSNDKTQTIRAKANGYDNYQWGLQEFLKEARALAKFKHNYIVRVLRFMEANGTAYMIMEYEEGESLGDYLKRTGGYLKEADLLKVFLPVLSGLQAVHDAGMLHLDIKPDNIYLRTDGTPMLIDFGSVRQTKANSPDQRVALTPAYSALEQYPTINREPGPWSDVYSMAATIYTCITGKPPTDVMKRYETLKRKFPDPLVPATKFERPIYAKHIRETVVHALELDPKKRPQSAIELQKALMGQSLEEARQVKKPSAGFNTGFIGVRRAPVQEKEEKKGRSFFEKFLLTLVIVPAIAVFTIQILIQTGVLNREQVYDRLDVFLHQTGKVADATKTELKRTLRLGDSPSVYDQTQVMTAEQIKKRKKHLQPFPLQRKLAQTFTGHKSQVVKLAFLPSGDILASVSADGTLNLWNVKTGKLVKTLSNPKDSFGAFALSDDGTLLAKSGQNNSIRIYDLVNNKATHTLKGHKDFINQMVFSPDGKYLATVSDDKSLILWDVATGKIVGKNDQFTDSVLSADFSPSGGLLVTGDASGLVNHWTIPELKRLANIQANKPGEEVNSVSFSPDGKWIATSGSSGFLKLWNTDLSDTDKDLPTSFKNVYATAFSPDSKWLLAAGTGNKVGVWDVKNGQMNSEVVTGEPSIYAVAVSSDGKWLAVSGSNKKIQLWKEDKTAAKVAANSTSQ